MSIASFILRRAMGGLRRLPTHIETHLLIRDEKGEESKMTFRFPSGSDIGVVQSWIRVMAQRIDAITLGQVVGAGLSLDVDLSGLGLKSAPVSGADVQEKGKMYMATTNGLITTVSIPTFDENFFDSNGAIADLNDLDIRAMTDHIIFGQTDGLTNVQPSNAYGDDIDDVPQIIENFASRN